MTESARIGVAFVGCTHPHIFYRIKLLAHEADVDLVGCYDPDPALAARFQVEYGLQVFDSADSLLDHPSVNFVVIEGWDTDNPSYAAKAAKRGHAILLEKPGAPDLASMQNLAPVLRGSRAPFKMGYQLRFNPVMPHILQVLQSGILGSITLARFHAAAPVGAAREPWQSVPGDLGGVMFTDGCHMIDLIVHLLGVPQRVSAMLLHLPEGETLTVDGYKAHTFAGQGKRTDLPLGGMTFEDAGTALFDYSDKLVTFDLTGWEAQPWVESWRLELFGTNATLYAGLQPPHYRLFVRTEHADYAPGWHEWHGTHLPESDDAVQVNRAYANEMAHMLHRIRTNDADNNQQIDDALAVIAVLDAMFRASRTGSTVNMEGAFLR